MNATMIGITAATLILIPIVGLGFYWLTYKLAHIKPLYLSVKQIGVVLTAIFVLLFGIDLAIHPYLTWKTYTKYQKTLPLGRTFLSPPSHPLPLSFPPARTETDPPDLKAQHRPNIYFFVIETLRRDFLTETIAPEMTRFGKEHLEFPLSHSNASSTHLSWFAIFHSDLPFYWAQRRDTWHQGSLPLRMLKKMGYEIHVKSSADLRFFNMDQLLFGKQREVADSIEEFEATLAPYARDALAIESVFKNLKPSGQVYLIFLDATHSEYSFPTDFSLRFTPIAKEVDYLTIHAKSPELEGLKNRYKNAIAYVDHLIGKFFVTLKQKNLFDDAIISITGDHGEEFFEEGALFHGTHLNSYQTSVPIFLKFPQSWPPQTDLITHIDLFPTILHFLTGQNDFSFDGQSIFIQRQNPYRIAFLQNGPDTPLEFTLHKEDLKLKARIADANQLDIVELQGFLEPDTLSPLLRKN
jgi:glucan phosphoethanolaminetransferase (alkaline phosphatase superfamily)